MDKAEGKEEVENEVEKVDYTYMWRFVDWSPCSVTCGEGKFMRYFSPFLV